MATPVVYNGVSYSIPAFGDVGYAQGPGNLSSYLIALASGPQTTGGLFSLTAPLNFGPNFGIVAVNYTSTTANPATAGTIRLAHADTIDWRNNANSANLPLGINGSDQLTYNGVVISTAAAGGTVNAGTINTLAYYAATGNSVSSLAAITASRALVSDVNGLPSASAVTAATLAFLDATSSVQTQLNTKIDTAGTGLTKTGTTLALTVPVSIANGGTNSTTALNNGRVIGSVGGAIVELALGQIPGVATSTVPTAGNIGQVISSTATTTVSTGVPKDLTSITLTAGNWLIHASVYFHTTATMTTSAINVGTVSGAFTGTQGINRMDSAVGTSVYDSGAVIVWQQSIAGSTTYFLTVAMNGTGTLTTGGQLFGVRIS